MTPCHRPVRRALILASFLAASLPGLARAFPDRTIEWVVPYPAGGGTDVVARVLAQEMSKTLGQSIIVNNKPGAATNIGADYTARARADGHVLMSADTATLAANPFLYSKLGYNVEKDFATVGLTVRFPLILVVNPALPVRNLEELRAWAAGQKDIAYATPGAGSPHHLATELFREKTRLPLTHVSYRGAAPAVQDVVAGVLPVMFVDTASGQQYIADGKLRPIGIASPRRVRHFESIPTLQEQGLEGFEAYAWQGLVVPAGTPADAIARLNQALLAALETTAVKARLQVLGLESTPSTPARMADYAASERAKWGPLIKAAGIKVD